MWVQQQHNKTEGVTTTTTTTTTQSDTHTDTHQYIVHNNNVHINTLILLNIITISSS